MFETRVLRSTLLRYQRQINDIAQSGILYLDSSIILTGNLAKMKGACNGAGNERSSVLRCQQKLWNTV